ncbi:Nif3-like dinuclear metal center hexameric protein [Timonella sp. A28]|uniref:Nif3-like dinuclear metal center hexameric protein n=1 Tax=Timonella sp. A28 TaxID=3442640 RepID=UPI003EBA0805
MNTRVVAHSTPETLENIVTHFEELYPPHLAEPWDKPGLAVGDITSPVRKIYFALDATRAVIDDAVAWGADLIVTHHPFLFNPLDSVTTRTDRGASIYTLIAHNCALFSAHTNADSARRGVNDALADTIGLINTRPLTPQADDETLGLGRVGELTQPMTLHSLAQHVADVLPQAAQGIRTVGDPDALVHKIAVLGGSGGSLLNIIASSDADVYITSDLKHHDVLDYVEAQNQTARITAAHTHATEENPTAKPHLIDTAHWASESVWLPYAAHDVASTLADKGITIETKVSDITTDPWTFHTRAD